MSSEVVGVFEGDEIVRQQIARRLEEAHFRVVAQSLGPNSLSIIQSLIQDYKISLAIVGEEASLADHQPNDLGRTITQVLGSFSINTIGLTDGSDIHSTWSNREVNRYNSVPSLLGLINEILYE